MRRELAMPVDTVPGHYGEFTVLVDGEPVLSGGQLAFLGILPTKRRVREAVTEHLASNAEAVVVRQAPPVRCRT